MKNELFFKLSKINWLMQKRHIQRHMQMGITADRTRGQGRILALLRIQDSISTKDLAYLLGVRVSSLNELLAKLEKNGFINREASNEDGRIYLVKLTEKGRAAGESDSECDCGCGGHSSEKCGNHSDNGTDGTVNGNKCGSDGNKCGTDGNKCGTDGGKCGTDGNKCGSHSKSKCSKDDFMPLTEDEQKTFNALADKIIAALNTELGIEAVDDNDRIRMWIERKRHHHHHRHLGGHMRVFGKNHEEQDNPHQNCTCETDPHEPCTCDPDPQDPCTCDPDPRNCSCNKKTK